MWENIDRAIAAFDRAVWGWPLILLILAVGLRLSLQLRFVQLRRLPHALRCVWRAEDGAAGEVSGFGALCTSLSATIGTGNIVGVATAIAEGGPGALFWLWAAAFLGMASKYAEGLLAVKYRTIDAAGHVLGGPFYYIERGMGRRFWWLSGSFALFGAGAGLLGIGTITQVSGIAEALRGFFDPQGAWRVELLGTSHSAVAVWTALLTALAAGAVIAGGLQRISGVSELLVPLMASGYLLATSVILLTHASDIPAAIKEILCGAFVPEAVAGGAAGTLLMTVQKGVARGVFSNEAGLGSAPIAAAAAATKEPARQGMIAMAGTFIDTFIVCTMTGLSILVTGAHRQGLAGVAVTAEAFREGLPLSGRASDGVLTACLVFFAYTTILGWNYYGERCVEYLCRCHTGGSGAAKAALAAYRALYVAAVAVGPFLSVKLVWNIADIFNALMALPNLIALAALSGAVCAETRRYESRLYQKQIMKSW